jgi:hypothetical protein
VSLEEIAERKFGTDSIQHFAARILHRIFLVKLHREIGNGVGAELSSFSAGCLITELEMKFKWEDFALAGQHMRGNLAEARQRGSRKRISKALCWKNPTRRAAADTWRERPQLSTSAVAKIVRKRLEEGDVSLPKSDRAVRDAIRDLSPQKAGSRS